MLKVEVVGKNGFTPSEANREYAEKKLSKLEHYFTDDLHARVVCKVYPTYHKVEITLPTRSTVLRAETTAKDVYAAIDCSIDKLVRQVAKLKNKLKGKNSNEGLKDFEQKLEAIEEQKHSIVRGKEIELDPMTRDEAIDQMELLGHDFFVYLDADTNKINVLYVREDGDYAVLETKTK